jgi:hypothetical protein
MSQSKMNYLSNKVYVHHWPKNSPVWPDSFQKKLDISINKNSNDKKIIVTSHTITIEDFEFINLKKIGISVPFFKKECTMIFEAQFETFFAHIHITIKSHNFIEIFNELISWKKKFNE